MEVSNAVITKTTITNNDHGMLSIWLHLDDGTCSQGFGGWRLYFPEDKFKSSCGHFMWRVMQVGGVTEWSQLPGKTVRIRRDDSGGMIRAVGHIVKNDWFDPAEEFKGA